MDSIEKLTNFLSRQHLPEMNRVYLVFLSFLSSFQQCHTQYVFHPYTTPREHHQPYF